MPYDGADVIILMIDTMSYRQQEPSATIILPFAHIMVLIYAMLSCCSLMLRYAAYAALKI